MNNSTEHYSEYLFGALCFGADFRGNPRPDCVAKWIVKLKQP